MFVDEAVLRLPTGITAAADTDLLLLVLRGVDGTGASRTGVVGSFWVEEVSESGCSFSCDGACGVVDDDDDDVDCCSR